MSQGETSDAPNPMPRGLLILLGLAAATVTVAGMKAAAGIIGPAFLALVLMITVYPIRTWLRVKGAPGWLCSLLTILTVYVILGVMLLALVVSLGRLAVLATTYGPQLDGLSQSVGSWLEARGVGATQVDAMVSGLDTGRLFSLTTSLFSGILGIMSNLVFVVTLTLFLGFDAARFPVLLADGRLERPAVVDALVSFSAGTRTYFGVSAAFGLAVAAIDTVFLSLMGVPGALVWGVLAFVTNFIPNIGFVIGVVPPAAMAFLDGGTETMIVVIVVYCATNFVIQSIIQPMFVGDALGISTTLTFLSLVFWAFVLGPLGAVLAIPLTLLVKALLVDVDPRSRWLVPLLSGQPSEPDVESATDVRTVVARRRALRTGPGH